MSARTRDLWRDLRASGDPLTIGIFDLMARHGVIRVVERVLEIDYAAFQPEPQKRGPKSIWVDELGRQNGLVLYVWLEVEVAWRLTKLASKKRAMDLHFQKLTKQRKCFSVRLPGGDHIVGTPKAACDLHADGERQLKSMPPSKVKWWRRKALEAIEAAP